jgi:hypothetical protein
MCDPLTNKQASINATETDSATPLHHYQALPGRLLYIPTITLLVNS